MPDDEIESEAESRAADRLNLFSDAVVAIAITLLAIELPLPEGGTVRTYAWVLWIVLPLLVARWNHRQRRRRPPPGRQPDGPGPDATGPAGSATQLDQEPT